MFELIYMSSATKKLTEEEINLLLLKARHYNIQHGITGVLLYIEGDFLQVLEGRKDAVMTLFEKIKKDVRNKVVIIVHEGEKEKRNFPDWSMGFHSSTYEKLRHITGFKDLDKPNFYKVDDKTAIIFLNDFIKSHNEKITFW